MKEYVCIKKKTAAMNKTTTFHNVLKKISPEFYHDVTTNLIRDDDHLIILGAEWCPHCTNAVKTTQNHPAYQGLEGHRVRIYIENATRQPLFSKATHEAFFNMIREVGGILPRIFLRNPYTNELELLPNSEALVLYPYTEWAKVVGRQC